MPLATIQTAPGQYARVRYEVHTPWTQVPRHPDQTDSAHDTSGYRPPSFAPGSSTDAQTAADELKADPASSQQQSRQHDSGVDPGSPPQGHAHGDQQQRPRQKLLIVASLGAPGSTGWFSHVAAHFAGLRHPDTGEAAADVVTFDNRRRWGCHGQAPPRDGVGGYGTEAMAADAVALMDVLGWRHAHMIGMSLGAMVAAKAAAAAPERIASLTLLGYTLNGWQMAASLVSRPDRLAKVLIGTRRSRLKGTLSFYFTPLFLAQPHQPPADTETGAASDAATAGAVLHGGSSAAGGGSGHDAVLSDSSKQYVQRQREADAALPGASDADVPVRGRGPASRHRIEALLRQQQDSGTVPSRQDAILAQALSAEDSSWQDEDRGRRSPHSELEQPDTGLKSHSLACLLHWLGRRERRTIASAGFPVHLIVGRHDPVSPPSWVAKAAASLRGTLIVTEASHAGLTVESCPEVLSAVELAMFGRTLADVAAWKQCQDAAIQDATSNPHLIKR